MYNRNLIDLLASNVTPGGYYYSSHELATEYNAPDIGYAFVFGATNRFCIIFICNSGKMLIRTNSNNTFTQIN